MIWLLLIPAVLVAIYVVRSALHQAELKRITPSNAELKKLAKRYPPPQEWWDEDLDTEGA